MTAHATLRTDYVEARIMGWLQGLSLPGSPTIYGADVPNVGTRPTPRLQVTFRELDGEHAGRFDATHSRRQMAMLVICDLWHGDGTDGAAYGLYDAHATVAELVDQLSFLTLSFLDYSTPSSPVTVSDVVLRVIRPAQARRLEDSDGLRRRQVRAVVEWIGRVQDTFAA